MPCNGRISSSYCLRIHPITKKQTFYRGMDIGVPADAGIKIGFLVIF